MTDFEKVLVVLLKTPAAILGMIQIFDEVVVTTFPDCTYHTSVRDGKVVHKNLTNGAESITDIDTFLDCFKYVV